MASSIKVTLIGDATSLNRALGEAEARTSSFGSKMGTVLKAGGVLAGVAIVAALDKSVKAAMEAQTSQARLAQAFKTAGLSAQASAGLIGQAEAASRKLGFTDSDVRLALGSMITATGDVGASMKDLSVAEDLARFKGIGLGDASKMMTMAMTGSQRAAKQLGIIVIPLTTNMDALKASNENLTTAVGKTDVAHAKLMDKMATGQAVIQQVTDKVHGQGQAYADTAAGGMAQFHAEVDHLEVALGTTLLPAVANVASALANLVNWLDTSKGVAAAASGTIDTLKEVYAALAPAVSAMAGAIEKEWPRVQAAAASVVSYYNNTVKPAFQNVAAAIEAIWGLFGGAIEKITSTYLGNTLTVIRATMTIIKDAIDIPLQILKGNWGKAWNDLKDIVSTALSAVVTVVHGFVTIMLTAAEAIGKAIFRGVVAGMEGLIGKVEDVLQGVGKAIISVAGEAFGWALGIGKAIVSGVISGITSLPGQLAGKLSGMISSAVHSAGAILHGSGEFMFTINAVGRPMAEGVISGFESGMAFGGPRAAKAVGNFMHTATDAVRSGSQEIISTVEGAWSKVQTATNKIAAAMSENAKALASGIGTSASGGPLAQWWIDQQAAASLAANPDASTGGYMGPTMPSLGAIVAAAGTGMSAVASPVTEAISQAIRPGLQFASGGIVPGMGPQLAIVHGGETITPAGARAVGNISNTFNFPNYVGDKRELVNMLRTEMNQIRSRNR